MIKKRTTYVHDGDTYSATFVEAGRGSDTVITVRYSGRELTQPLGSANASATASAMLAQMVLERLSGREAVRVLH